MIVLDSAGFSLLAPLIYGHACNHQNQKEQLPGKGAASIQVSGTDLKGQLGVQVVTALQGIFFLQTCFHIVQGEGTLAFVVIKHCI